MTENLSLSGVIQFLRKKRHLSARALSLQSGLSPSYVSKIENGTIEPSLRAFISLAKVLDMTDAELLFIVRRL